LEKLKSLVLPEQKPVSQKIIRNVLFSGLRAALLWPIPLILIPYILSKIGVTNYGIWAVFLAIISLTALSDMGLAGTLTKHVAEYYARKDTPALNRLVDTGLMLYMLIAALLVGALCLASGLLIPLFFHEPLIPRPQLQVLWYLFSGIVAVNTLAIPFYSIVNGLQRMDLSNILTSVSVLARALLTVVLLWRGQGLEGLVLANLLAPLLTLLCYIWVVHRLVPELNLNPLRSEPREIKHIFSFGLQVYLTQIATTVHMQIDKLYLALFTGLAAAGFYNIASDTAWKIRTIPEMLLSPVMAAASELDANGAQEKLRELYFRCHKYVALCGLPAVVFVVTFSRPLVQLWLGPKLAVVAFPLAVLAAIDFFNLTCGPGYLIFIGRGVLRPGIYSAFVGVLLNLLLSLVLIYYFGLSGAVWGTTIAVFVGTAYFVYLFHHQTGYPLLGTIQRAYLKPFLCSVASAGVLLAVGGHLAGGWPGVFLKATLFGMLYILGVTLTRFFDQFDLAKAESVFPAVRFARRIIPVA
jgi:O-antigen/teichoic acid export membrane protein